MEDFEQAPEEFFQQKRPLNLVVKIFSSLRKEKAPPVVVEFSPDDSSTAERVDKYLHELRMKRSYPNFDECMNISHMFGIRARVTKMDNYLGHIFENGDSDVKNM
jgi:hypothetical protein